MEMDKEKFRVFDECGDSMLLRPFKEKWYEDIGVEIETVENLEKLPLRETDILLCSYAKSGCHWVWEIIRLLKKFSVDKIDDEMPEDKEQYMIEFNTFDDLAKMKGLRILNNHCLFHHQPLDLLKKKIKVVFVYRNIKDIAVSFYHHHTRSFELYEYKAPFSNYLKRLAAGLVDGGGNVFEYLKDWEEGILNNPDHIHVVCYEDLKKNPAEEIKKISHFLGTNEDADFIQQVADDTDINAMRKRKEKDEKAFKDDKGLIMYRKGTAGDWKNYFTVAESEWFDSLIEKHLGQSKIFKFKYIL